MNRPPEIPRVKFQIDVERRKVWNWVAKRLMQPPGGIPEMLTEAGDEFCREQVRRLAERGIAPPKNVSEFLGKTENLMKR